MRQSLGAAYVRQGKLAEAEAVFREDLRRNPGNPRSLFELNECLRRAGKPVDAEAEKQFQKSWGSNPPPAMESL